MTPGQKSVADEAKLARARQLQEKGFVHVTGLPMWSFNGYSLIQARRSELGHHDYNNGKLVIVTEDGEVWLTVGKGWFPPVINFLWGLSVKGAFVPCSNGENIETHVLLQRVADPYSDRYYSAIPQIKD